MPNIIDDRRVLWYDETVHPGSLAMHLAMQAVEADQALVREWQAHCDEMYEGSDWICYGEWLEVELEMTLDNLVDIDLGSAHNLIQRAYNLVTELARGTRLDAMILRKCTGTRYPVNLDAPEEGTDIHHSRPCPVHTDAFTKEGTHDEPEPEPA